jgi:hypothetical protein
VEADYGTYSNASSMDTKREEGKHQTDRLECCLRSMRLATKGICDAYARGFAYQRTLIEARVWRIVQIEAPKAVAVPEGRGRVLHRSREKMRSPAPESRMHD